MLFHNNLYNNIASRLLIQLNKIPDQALFEWDSSVQEALEL